MANEPDNEVRSAQDEVIQEFAFFDNWMDRYQYLIDLGRRLPALADEELVDENKIKGCQSQVWLVASEADGRLHFKAISDAVRRADRDGVSPYGTDKEFTEALQTIASSLIARSDRS